MYRDTRLSKPELSAPTEFAPLASRLRLRHVAYLAIAALLSVGILSATYLLLTTTESADAIALRHEKALVREALHHQLVALTHEQAFPAMSDETLRQVHSGALQPDYAAELTRQMWSDFGHDWTLVVGPGNDILMVAAENERIGPEAGAEILAVTADLIEKAREGYFTARRPSNGGYRIKYIEKGELAPIFAFDVRDVAGQPALVSAMAIIPETEVAVHPDGPPGVFISVRSIEPKMLSEIGETFLLDDFRYALRNGSGDAHVPVAINGEPPIGYFEWNSSTPGTVIRAAVIPVAIGLMVGFIGIGCVVGRKLAIKSRALEESEARNRYLALHDSLTGLPNRTYFGDELDDAMEDCQKTPCAVLAIDLDRFKAVNDTYGHDAGDLVIRAVGTRLLNLIGDIGLVSRVGGDEFLALITGNVEESQIRWLCDTIVEELAQPISVGGGIARIGASIGWALAPRNGDTASMLLRMADQSLYNAKENGRNCAVFIEDLYQQDAPPSARKSA